MTTAGQTGTGSVGNRLGPYENWMFSIGKVFDLPDLMLHDSAHLSAVAEFSHPVASADSSLLPGTGPYVIRVPTLYRDQGFQARFLPFMLSPATAGTNLLGTSAQAVHDLVAQVATASTGQVRLNFPIRNEQVDPATPRDAPLPPIDSALSGQAPRVILAIVDLGIPFAHDRLRHPGTKNTRIDYCWSQSAPTTGSGEVLFGREFRRDRIDAMVAGHNGDEDAIYAEAGLLSRPGGPPMPLSRAQSHGAHCLDLLAGGWPAASAAQARIIAVDLPSSPVRETSGFGKDMFILAAFHYIFNRAELLRQAYGCDPLPLVINISYGYSGGPHDGSGLIEAALAEMVAHRNCRAATTLVMPAGNLFQGRLFAHLTDRHFAPVAGDPAHKTATLHWFAPPNDRTSSYLEFWYPPDIQPQDISLAVAAPGSDHATSTDLLPKGGSDLAVQPILVGGKIVGHLTLDHHRASRWRVMVLLAPSETFAAPDRLLVGQDRYGTTPAGRWTLTFRLPTATALPEAAGLPEAAAPGVIGGIQAFIQRDTSYGQGNTGARQSYFVDPHDQPFGPDGILSRGDQTGNGAALRRFGSLNGMATAAETLVVGGQIVASGKAAEYCSAVLSAAMAPATVIGKAIDISAPTERSPVLRGMIGAGTRSATTVAASGTSSACPQVARLLALSQIDTPLPIRADHAAVLQRLAGLPNVKAVTEAGNGPTSRLRLGGLVLRTADETDTGDGTIAPQP